jgi:hypothetical protein
MNCFLDCAMNIMFFYDMCAHRDYLLISKKNYRTYFSTSHLEIDQLASLRFKSSVGFSTIYREDNCCLDQQAKKTHLSLTEGAERERIQHTAHHRCVLFVNITWLEKQENNPCTCFYLLGLKSAE